MAHAAWRVEHDTLDMALMLEKHPASEDRWPETCSPLPDRADIDGIVAGGSPVLRRDMRAVPMQRDQFVILWRALPAYRCSVPSLTITAEPPMVAPASCPSTMWYTTLTCEGRPIA